MVRVGEGGVGVLGDGETGDVVIGLTLSRGGGGEGAWFFNCLLVSYLLITTNMGRMKRCIIRLSALRPSLCPRSTLRH